MNVNEEIPKTEEIRYPIPYKIYKGMKGKYGALRFNLKKAYSSKKKKDNQSGVVFFEACPADGPNNYTWQTKKISFALGLTDISSILLYLQAPNHPDFADNNQSLTLVHDRGLVDSSSRKKDLTYFNIIKMPEHKSFWFNIKKMTNRQEEIKVSIPVSIAESIIIRKLLEAAIPSILAWD